MAGLTFTIGQDLGAEKVSLGCGFWFLGEVTPSTVAVVEGLISICWNRTYGSFYDLYDRRMVHSPVLGSPHSSPTVHLREGGGGLGSLKL